MPDVWFGRKDEAPTRFDTSHEFVALRTTSPHLKAMPEMSSLSAVVTGAPVLTFPEANVSVYRVGKTGEAGVADAKRYLQSLSDVRFAGRVLVDAKSREPVVYTENIFVKFADDRADSDCRKVIADAGLQVKRKLDYAKNAYFAGATEGTGQQVFEIARKLLDRDDVEYCHPEVVRRRSHKKVFAEQWHLRATTIATVPVAAHAHVEAAHAFATGKNITIAIIDDGVDIDHPEFATAGKIVAPRDVTMKNDDPRPKDMWFREDHGTACSGVACANGVHGACGVAPNALLMPIRLNNALGSLAEAEAFYWAAQHGADVISCSWGPEDGNWTNPDDPLHTTPVALPAQTQLAIDYAATKGRNGRGCVIFFAAGNGNEGVQFDGYASYAMVIAVAASNDRSVRSGYSDFGPAVWCAFPSNDAEHPPTGRPKPLTRGIWTVDRSGHAGYNSGQLAAGDAAGFYTATFGGTSSACPGAAGVAALILSAKPTLTRDQVKDVIAQTCEKIDAAGGTYNAQGWSPFYGYGRINAEAAVKRALAMPNHP
jgi:subtilisin family serine protease